MKIKNLIKVTSLVLILGITNQSYSETQKNNIMKKTKTEKIGLLVTMTAKSGKEQAVKQFLLGGLALVNKEPLTESWFAFQLDERTFGIYDTFEAEEGRQAHLTGEVAKALLSNAGELLEGFDASKDIQQIDIITSNHKPSLQNKGLLVIMKAQEGKSAELEGFLNVGKELVGSETKTASWYAIKIDNSTYAIFDTFAGIEGRDEHLNGKVAAALIENAPRILDGFGASAIQKINILASK
ncbi:MAG: putative quinol monooxygenase [Flavobacteriales bacterium]